MGLTSSARCVYDRLLPCSTGESLSQIRKRDQAPTLSSMRYHLTSTATINRRFITLCTMRIWDLVYLHRSFLTVRSFSLIQNNIFTIQLNSLHRYYLNPPLLASLFFEAKKIITKLVRTKSTFLHLGTGPLVKYLKFQLALASVIRLPSHPSTAPLSHPKRCFEAAKSANLITHLSAPWRCLFFLQILELALSTAEKA